MGILERFSQGLAKIMYWVAGTAIISMMVLTCIDVIFRLCVTLYHKFQWGFLSSIHPIPGTYELVSFIAAIAVAFAMAHTSVQRGHVAVTLIVRLFPPRVQATIGSITDSFGFILFALLCWRCVLYGNHLMEINEVSLNLELPYYPFVYGVAFSAAAVCLVILIDLIKNVKKVIGK